MSDLRELYQEVIIDHSKHPRNFGPLGESNRHAEGINPLCGDRVTIHLNLRNGKIEAAGFEGSGCAISTASASMMTDHLAGKTAEEALAIFERFHGLVTGELAADDLFEDLGKLAVFAGVSDFPARVKCAILAWHSMRAALLGGEQAISTE